MKSAERFDFSCMVMKRKMPRTDVWEMCSRCIRSGGVGPFALAGSSVGFSLRQPHLRITSLECGNLGASKDI